MISKTVVRWLTLVAMVGLCLGVMVPAASATDITSCPFTISAAGDFVVTKNLTAAGTDCIKVHHSNVAIDMKGHTIKGDGTHNGITDNGFFVEDVAISHGKIKDFDEAINFFGDDGFGDFSELITLEEIEVTDSKHDGIFILGPFNSITDVKANKNGEEGVEVNEGCCNLLNKIQANDNTGEGVKVNFSRATANQITANRNGKNGMRFGGSRSSVSNSQANDNKTNGIFMSSSSESVANVRTNGNASAGINITGDRSRVTNATANNNGDDGIEFGNGEEHVADSVANNNKVIGIDLGNGDFNTVTDVTANHNATGVKLECPGNAVKVSAHNNSGTQLLEIFPADCTNLLNKAP